MTALFAPVRLGPYTLDHRVVMAPLTRMRAGPGEVPTALMASYYAQRATPGGLLISEATPVSPRAFGYAHTPGIFTRAQVAGWRPVTEAVHARGGRIFLQLWHVGRQSHSDLQPGGALPVAPSAIAAVGDAYTETGPKPHPVPRALGIDEIAGVVAEFRQGAAHALAAGFRRRRDPRRERIPARPIFAGRQQHAYRRLWRLDRQPRALPARDHRGRRRGLGRRARRRAPVPVWRVRLDVGQ